jgi:hypothetical protein
MAESDNILTRLQDLLASGATLTTTDSVANGPQRFYRLVLSP